MTPEIQTKTDEGLQEKKHHDQTADCLFSLALLGNSRGNQSEPSGSGDAEALQAVLIKCS